MEEFNLILPCHFGLEVVAKRELNDIGIKIIKTSDGEITAKGSFFDIVRLNMNLRTVERVMIEVANFNATTFEELYDNVFKIPIENFVPVDGNFVITKANSDKNSILHSQTSIQSIVKKSMVDRLKKAYKTNFLCEERGKYPFRVKFNKNNVSVRLDTTGVSLHKRGYRIRNVVAPIEETLASALILLTPFKKNRILIDPFCGSGTIPIEAGLIACNIPPNMNRAFVFESWNNIYNKKLFKEAYDEAESKIDYEYLNSKNKYISGFDIDNNAINISIENAKRSSVFNLINFQRRDIKDLKSNDKYGFIITNPPYGERLENEDTVKPIYEVLKNRFNELDNWSMYVITSYKDAEKVMGVADKNRKIYNGMLKTYFYSYIGKKPNFKL